jgi:pyruvate/2-oxoglutarate dehydrogenase complex dihydrolipoamide dehydrogenase (E3) component
VSLGLTEELARVQGLRVRVLRADLGESLRGRLEGKSIGRLKIIADRRGRILGAHALAAEAPEWMGLIGLAMQRGVTLAQLSELPIASTTYAALVVQLAEPSRSARQDYWAERWLNWRRTGSV